MGCDVETGRKGAPLSGTDVRAAVVAFNEAEAVRRGNPELQHAEWRQAAIELPKLTSAVKVCEALAQSDEWRHVSLSQVRRAVTAANKLERGGETLSEKRRAAEGHHRTRHPWCAGRARQLMFGR